MNELLASLLQALRFWSRLPVPEFSFEAAAHGVPDMERLAPVLPFAGAVLGGTGALLLIVLHGLGLAANPSAVFVVAVLVIVTGAMHEDGLADMADGFGGGRSVDRKLEIMRDSRIGSYGASALVLSIAARIALIAGLATALGAFRAGLIIIAAAGVSRIAGLMPLAMLPSARGDGAGAAAGRLSLKAWQRGALIGLAISASLAWLATGLGSGLAAAVASFAVAYAVTRLAQSQIGGQTGDICGAATLLAEIAFLALASFGL